MPLLLPGIGEKETNCNLQEILEPLLVSAEAIAQEINLKLASLHQALFIESSPGPVKYAASLLGLCNANTRLPLSSIKNDTKELIKSCLKELQLL